MLSPFILDRKGMDKEVEELKKIVEDSECVLIGIGSEFAYNALNSEVMRIFSEKKKAEGLGEEADWLLPFIKSYSCIHQESEETLKAYDNLYQLIKGKKYFIVTLNEDEQIRKSELEQEKITAPCGSMYRLQCSCGCEDSITDAADIVEKVISELKQPETTIAGISKPVCEKCGKDLVFNIVEAENYLESGYLKSWEKYRMWLTGTLNRKVCLLELGVDFKYPSIIRWAFEKVAFINEKAVFVRINEKYPQLTEELKEKAYSYHKNSVEFFQ